MTSTSKKCLHTHAVLNPSPRSGFRPGEAHNRLNMTKLFGQVDRVPDPVEDTSHTSSRSVLPSKYTDATILQDPLPVLCVHGA